MPSSSKRRRNSTVASHLDRDDLAESLQSLQYAQPADARSLLQRTRKRQVIRNGNKPSARKKTDADVTITPNQTLASESFEATKHFVPVVANRTAGCGEHALPTPVASIAVKERQRLQQTETPSDDNVAISTAPATKSPSSRAAGSANEDRDHDFGQSCFDFGSRADNSPCSVQPKMLTQHLETQSDECNFGHGFDDDFDDDLEDEDLLHMDIEPVSSTDVRFSLPVLANVANNTLRQTQTAGTLESSVCVPDVWVSDSSPLSGHFVSPITPRTRVQATIGNDAPKPIVRSPFPTRVRECSPIIGLSSDELLRTCFRVGEAINQSCQAAKTGSKALIELYARVLNSERDEIQQHFTFCDLFHAKPPYIHATYAAAVWKTVELYEYDSSRLLQPGRLCRCMGKMKRNGKGWTMSVMNIWEATWEDVEWVEGIVNS